ncbi:MAG: 50S ribosomal protein L11 methyltransferase [Syntrophales bacterium]|nr:50S ribosomal protein L11 methyltransferase [Syntrophales bacterium]MDD4339871.1 50S ribosomal protein L11 methyltransferase [Syntrophales bacterium]
MPAKQGMTPDKRERWFKIELSTPPELVDALANYVTEIGAQGAYQEVLEPFAPNDRPAALDKLNAFLPVDTRLENRLARLETYLASLGKLFPEYDPVTLTTETIDDPDWGEQWKKYFKPLRVSKNIVIKPTWERFTPQGHDIVIDIDPGMAFGTGQHPSTRMCLEAMEDILLKNRSVRKARVLDVGTGTGILGIASAKLGAEAVVCVDIDRNAADIARENVRINGVEDRVKIVNRDVTTLHDPFSLIIANLTARLLVSLRSHLVSLLTPGGYLVLSGIIDQNRPEMEAHFFAPPFVSRRTITEKEWVCYVLQNEEQTP